MYLKHKTSGDMVEVMDINVLVDPFKSTVLGRYHAGEELQEPMEFKKSDLIFPSEETLPVCWSNPHYRD